MVHCLLQDIEMVSEKVVNFDKLQEITQLADENPAIFKNRLQETMVQYTRLDLASQWEPWSWLSILFLSQQHVRLGA